MATLPSKPARGKLSGTGKVADIIEYLDRKEKERRRFGHQPIDPGTGWTYFGQVVGSGPESEADYTDNRYWVRILGIKYAVNGRAPMILQVDNAAMDGKIVTCINLAEQSGTNKPPTEEEPHPQISWAGPHGLPLGTHVEMYYRFENHHNPAQTAKDRLVTWTLPRHAIQVRITDVDLGAGVYAGYEIIPPTGPLPANANAAALSFGTNGPTSVRIINRREVATSGHMLDPNETPNIFDAYLIKTENDGKRVYAIDGYQEDLGQYQGMVKQMVTDLAVGYDRIRGHGLI